MGVGQLIGKLFGGVGKNEALLRAYGKLPMYAEYRRLEVAPGTPTAASQWMDAGRLAWVRSTSGSGADSAGSTRGTTRASRLLFGLPGTKEAIVANVWDSHDSLGRVFPFAFFVVCPPEALGSDLVERWVTATTIHRSFDRFYAQLHSLGSGGDFYRFYQKKVIALRPEDLAGRVRALREQAGNIAAEPWFKALDLGSDVSPATWFAGLLRRAERWKAQSDSLTELAVSCPLARGFPHVVQVVVWLEWLKALFKRIGRAPWLVVPADSEKSNPALHLVARDLLPDDYQLLTTDDHAYGYVEHLASTPETDVETPSQPPADPGGNSLLTWLIEHAP